jgi:hypothetical protein
MPIHVVHVLVYVSLIYVYEIKASFNTGTQTCGNTNRRPDMGTMMMTTILSRVRGSLTNNNGFWIG